MRAMQTVGPIPMKKKKHKKLNKWGKNPCLGTYCPVNGRGHFLGSGQLQRVQHTQNLTEMHKTSHITNNQIQPLLVKNNTKQFYT
jgi:hypothetical protein